MLDIPKFTIKEDETITIINFNCDLDASVIPSIRKEINQCQTLESNSIIIDLSAVSFLDSHAIGLFASLLKKANTNNNQLAFSGTEGQPKSVLSMVGFNNNLVKYYDNITDAISELK